jgi:rhodanese-related sulfurtransferase
MENIKYLLTLVFVVALSFLSCAQQTEEDEISVSDLKKAMLADSTLVILDVRTPEEIKGPLGILKGAINIPLQELSNRLDELEKYKDDNIAVVCKIGKRSHIATKILIEHGFKAKNVSGGMKDYRNSEN